MRHTFVLMTETDVTQYFLTTYGFWTGVRDCGDVRLFPSRAVAKTAARKYRGLGGRTRILTAKSAGVEER